MANKVKHRKIKREVMSFAEALHREGRQEGGREGIQEGQEKGVLIGRIQAIENLFGKGNARKRS